MESCFTSPAAILEKHFRRNAERELHFYAPTSLIFRSGVIRNDGTWKLPSQPRRSRENSLGCAQGRSRIRPRKRSYSELPSTFLAVPRTDSLSRVLHRPAPEQT